MPLVLGAWAAYALRVEPLGPPHVVIDAIAELAPDFDELMGFGD